MYAQCQHCWNAVKSNLDRNLPMVAAIFLSEVLMNRPPMLPLLSFCRLDTISVSNCLWFAWLKWWQGLGDIKGRRQYEMLRGCPLLTEVMCYFTMPNGTTQQNRCFNMHGGCLQHIRRHYHNQPDCAWIHRRPLTRQDSVQTLKSFWFPMRRRRVAFTLLKLEIK